VPRPGIPSAPERYDIRVEPDGQDRRQVVGAVAALLGLDPRLAQKLVDSGSPLRRGVRRGEAEYLRARFSDWGVSVHVEPDSPERPSGAARADPVGCIQASLGLVIGGLAGLVLMGADPFGVLSFPLPPGADARQVATAFARWNSSTGVIIGRCATAWMPLLVSGLCGVFAHRSLPASIPAALLRMVGVSSLLLLVSQVGSWAIDRTLSTGESSDVRTPLAMLAFEALCLSLAAPLSSAVTRRRSGGWPGTDAT
jgi:hypothetical protein